MRGLRRKGQRRALEAGAAETALPMNCFFEIL
jgi:hypothetical protein